MLRKAAILKTSMNLLIVEDEKRKAEHLRNTIPGLAGYQLAKSLRPDKLPTSILMLTAKDPVQDIVMDMDLQ